MHHTYVALENLRSLYNIGAIFRTCAFFGVSKVILVGYSGKRVNSKGITILHPEVKKTSLGSEDFLDLVYLENSESLVNYAKEQNIPIFSLEQTPSATSISTWKPPIEPRILVLGNEVTGVSDLVIKNSTQTIQIARTGSHNSLNVTTACGIALAKLAKMI